ncbi:hypothetical protein EJB05_11744, partial [Eragrostis curvula]
MSYYEQQHAPVIAYPPPATQADYAATAPSLPPGQTLVMQPLPPPAQANYVQPLPPGQALLMQPLPPPPQANYVHPVPPPGYPGNFNAMNPPPPQVVTPQTQSRGDKAFWEGCCAALCCCCLLDMCC